MNYPIVVFDHVSFGYERLSILTDINVQIYAGEYVGVFGPNGGGKTTFLHLLLGLLQPTSGKIILSPSSLSRSTGFVPQRFPFDPQFPIEKSNRNEGDSMGFNGKEWLL